MNSQSFSTAFLVDQTPEEVFAAINNVRGWWSEQIEGPTDELGGVFKFRHKDIHHSTHQVTKLIPGKKVVWYTVDSQINFVEDKNEWTGTEVIFEISQIGNQTELRFTHVGLIPPIACYDNCSDAWNFYVNKSLQALITTGKGQPNPKEVALTNPS